MSKGRGSTAARKTLSCRMVGRKSFHRTSKVEIILGTSDLANLWPQPYAGDWNAHVKDRLEAYVRAEVIAGRMGLKEAQHCFIPDWTASYKKFGLDKMTSIPGDPDDS